MASPHCLTHNMMSALLMFLYPRLWLYSWEALVFAGQVNFTARAPRGRKKALGTMFGLIPVTMGWPPKGGRGWASCISDYSWANQSLSFAVVVAFTQ
jgi:hypothetical protein